jgi:hypothetical protein
MKKSIIILLFLVFTLLSCNKEEAKKDGIIVKDAYGNYYRLDYRMGVVFALQKIDTNQLKIVIPK